MEFAKSYSRPGLLPRWSFECGRHGRAVLRAVSEALETDHELSLDNVSQWDNCSVDAVRASQALRSVSGLSNDDLANLWDAYDDADLGYISAMKLLRMFSASAMLQRLQSSKNNNDINEGTDNSLEEAVREEKALFGLRQFAIPVISGAAIMTNPATEETAGNFQTTAIPVVSQAQQTNQLRPLKPRLNLESESEPEQPQLEKEKNLILSFNENSPNNRVLDVSNKGEVAPPQNEQLPGEFDFLQNPDGFKKFIEFDKFIKILDAIEERDSLVKKMAARCEELELKISILSNRVEVLEKKEAQLAEEQKTKNQEARKKRNELSSEEEEKVLAPSSYPLSSDSLKKSAINSPKQLELPARKKECVQSSSEPLHITSTKGPKERASAVKKDFTTNCDVNGGYNDFIKVFQGVL